MTKTFLNACAAPFACIPNRRDSQRVVKNSQTEFEAAFDMNHPESHHIPEIAGVALLSRTAVAFEQKDLTIHAEITGGLLVDLEYKVGADRRRAGTAEIVNGKNLLRLPHGTSELVVICKKSKNAGKEGKVNLKLL